MLCARRRRWGRRVGMPSSGPLPQPALRRLRHVSASPTGLASFRQRRIIITSSSEGGSFWRHHRPVRDRGGQSRHGTQDRGRAAQRAPHLQQPHLYGYGAVAEAALGARAQERSFPCARLGRGLEAKRWARLHREPSSGGLRKQGVAPQAQPHEWCGARAHAQSAPPRGLLRIRCRTLLLQAAVRMHRRDQHLVGAAGKAAPVPGNGGSRGGTLRRLALRLYRQAAIGSCSR